jgi:hypothetical protein
MALVDEVRAMIVRLGPKGWAKKLKQHGLDLDKAAQSNQDTMTQLLEKPIAVDRNKPGFADFSTAGQRGITPAKPARSLLYHALASPVIYPSVDNAVVEDAQAYPTISELDLLENFIFGVAKRLAPKSGDGLLIAVLAYQYRTGRRSPHRQHADLAFSRTGVSRVGTLEAFYDAPHRSFCPISKASGKSLHVVPARFGAFLAKVGNASSSDGSLLPDLGSGPKAGNADATFVYPVHKLFSGNECLFSDNGSGLPLQLNFDEYHRSDKLAKIHDPQAGGLNALPIFDLTAPPFVRDSVNSAANAAFKLVFTGNVAQNSGAAARTGSVLLHPQQHKALSQTAVQKVGGVEELVRFEVPKGHELFETSLRLAPPDEGFRTAPEYVNIRLAVADEHSTPPRLEDVNEWDEPKFKSLFGAQTTQSTALVAHLIDHTCDGVIQARVQGLVSAPADLCAFSLVTAPDFFPYADQVDVYAWEQKLPRVSDEGGNQISPIFRQGGARPLSDNRMPGNLTLPRPHSTKLAFSPTQRVDRSMTAVTGFPAASSAAGEFPALEDTSTSHLPDAASSVFAPGWDVSAVMDATHGPDVPYLASFGLGSPFPEDSKLCAALNSFWPAVAPDASREFRHLPTAIPLLDSELGFHPQHPRVLAGEVASSPGWDGEYGPFFTTGNRANFAHIGRSDYSQNSMRQLLHSRDLSGVHASALIDRMTALANTTRALTNGVPSRSSLFLVQAEAIENWAARADRGDPSLTGPGYLFVFAVNTGSAQQVRDTTGEKWRWRKLQAYNNRFFCQVVIGGPLWTKNEKTGATQLVAHP